MKSSRNVKRKNGDTRRLCELAVNWVALNPTPLKLPPRTTTDRTWAPASDEQQEHPSKVWFGVASSVGPPVSDLQAYLRKHSHTLGTRIAKVAPSRTALQDARPEYGETQHDRWRKLIWSRASTYFCKM